MRHILARGHPLGTSIAERIESDFTYHPPKEGQPAKYEALRARAKGLAELIVESTLDDATIVTDGRMVQQILANLIENACKYSRASAGPDGAA